MNQKNELHGIERDSFFQTLMLNAVTKGMDTRYVENWMDFFDKKLANKNAAVADGQLAAGCENLAEDNGAAGEDNSTSSVTGLTRTELARQIDEALSAMGDSTTDKVVVNHLHLKALLYRLSAVWFGGNLTWAQCEFVVSLSVFYPLIADFLYGQQISGVRIFRAAYILATVYHETAHTMRPIEEYGKGKGHPYGDIDPETKVAYYGRGYVQLTWRANYARAEEQLIPTHVNDKPSLVWEPDNALVPFYAMQIAIRGMEEGWFTGKGLGDYLIPGKPDYYNARRVINGTDCADRIATYAREAETAIRLANGERIDRELVKGGSRGADVHELQLMLKLTPDGIAGEKTVAAIMDFQGKNGLTADGMCGQNTWDALDASVYGLSRHQANSKGMDSKWEA